jgi:hypothetical protein
MPGGLDAACFRRFDDEKDLGAVRPFAGDRTAAARMKGALKRRPRKTPAKRRDVFGPK